MDRPNECKYCGCNKFNADSVSMTRFRCGSSYWHNEEMWQLSNECAHKCAVQSAELRERVQRAVDELKTATRYTVTPGPRNTLDWDTNPDWSVTDSAAVDEALAILEGERDE